jgi:hypothetical protein
LVSVSQFILSELTRGEIEMKRYTRLAAILPWTFVLTSLATAAPTPPPGVPKAQHDLVRRTYDVLVRGHLAFLASTVGVVAVDVKDPTKPRYIGALLLPDSVNGLGTVGDKLLAALGPAGLVVVDASRPDQMKRIATTSLSGAVMGVAGVKEVAIVASGTAGIQAVDLSNPKRPRKVSHWDTPGYARAIRVKDEIAYLADGTAGVQLFRVAGKKLNHLKTLLSRGHVHDLALLDKLLLVAEGSAGLGLVDVSDPSKPRPVGRIGVKDTARGVCTVGTGKKLAIVADGTKGVAVFDISDPRRPKEIDRYKPKRSVNKVLVAGDLAFVANDYDGLLILRISLTGKLSFVGALPSGNTGKK